MFSTPSHHNLSPHTLLYLPKCPPTAITTLLSLSIIFFFALSLHLLPPTQFITYFTKLYPGVTISVCTFISSLDHLLFWIISKNIPQWDKCFYLYFSFIHKSNSFIFLSQTAHVSKNYILKGLMDMDNSVVIAEWRGVRGLSGNGKKYNKDFFKRTMH